MTTLRDVAERVGVTAKTASLALRGLPGVSRATANRVMEAAEELNYSSDRRRARRRSLTIGVCIPDLESANYWDLSHNIIYFAWARGFVVIPQATNDNPADERRAVEMFKRLSVEGVILTSSRVGEDAVRELEDEGILVVSIVSLQPDLGGPLSYFSTAPLTVDHLTSSLEATQYLISLGHERIAYLAGPWNSSSDVAKREGYKAALRQADIAETQALIIQLDRQRSDYQVGYDACWELLYVPEPSRPTAMVCYNDEIALGALACLGQHDIEVPGEMSVVGNDDIKPSRFWNPPLTTVRVPHSFLAQAAVDLVDTYVRNQGEIKKYPAIVPKLVVRGSTAPPKAAS